MNKFDDLIKDAQAVYEPDPEFVDKTMKRIKDHRPRGRFAFKVWVPALVGSLAFAAFVITSLPATDTTNSNSVNIAAGDQKQQKSVPSAEATPLEEGTDNASLERALAELAAVSGQTDADQTDVEAAFNDSSHQIVIPSS